jgi:hypothetical protein
MISFWKVVKGGLHMEYTTKQREHELLSLKWDYVFKQVM